MKTLARDVKTILKDEFEKRIELKPNLSMREFAFHLEIDAGTLHHLMSGKRAIGEKRARRLLAKLDYSDHDIDAILARVS